MRGGERLRGGASGTSPVVASIITVLSTGRCGTQWLTATAQELAGSLIEVRHEPIGAAYAPRRHFRNYAAPHAVLEEPDVTTHLDWVDGLKRPYLETGWPLFAALPLMAERWTDRLRVVHLTRHPVPTALSHLAHSCYAGSDRHDPFTCLATLGPGDPRVFMPAYAARWEGLSPYERCLYWWAEVNRFGLEFSERYAAIPLLRVRSEALLGGEREALRSLVAFLGLPWDERWAAATRRRVDRWHHHTDRPFDPLAICRHPSFVTIAETLGYDMQGIDHEQLRARYCGTPTSD